MVKYVLSNGGTELGAVYAYRVSITDLIVVGYGYLGA